MLLTNMEATSGNFSLPAVCHVVCTIVAAGITGINVTTSEPATSPTPPHNQPSPLPQGYVAYPDLGVAYKLYDEEVSWVDARRRCVERGAQLALIDSVEKIGYVKRQKGSAAYAHVGIVRMYENSTWVGVSTGFPTVSSLPWLDNYPVYPRGDCVRISFVADRLYNDLCRLRSEDNENYVCEIPILDKNTLIPN